VLELMVVIGIIALLSVIALPAIRGMTRSNTMSSANRQLSTISRWPGHERSTAVNRPHCFCSDEHCEPERFSAGESTRSSAQFRDRRTLTNLWSGAQIRYALFAERTAEINLVTSPSIPHRLADVARRSIYTRLAARYPGAGLPDTFPTIDGDRYNLPQHRFDQSGAIIDTNGLRRTEGLTLSLARGSIMFQRNDIGEVTFYDARENPRGNSIDNYNRVRIDGPRAGRVLSAQRYNDYLSSRFGRCS